MRIRITAGPVSAEADLNDTPTARAVGAALPIEAAVSTWGDEIYFAVPVEMGLEPGALDLVEPGDLGYWPTGGAFCVFFGPTPASRTPDEVRPASAVNVIGRVRGDATVFKRAKDGDPVRIEKVV